jgi:uncharacterized circularly permuted ATP-grasp superfamily protein
MEFKGYESHGCYDELIDSAGNPRAGSRLLVENIARLDTQSVLKRQEAAEVALSAMGVTFRVYDDSNNLERSIPFDILPRVIPASEWDPVRTGLSQRIRALNKFIDDIYHDQNIIRDGVFPRWVLENSKGFLPQCVGLNPPAGVWAHICGTDLVRDDKGILYVLEDNLRVPSGISYVLLNRELMKRNFPEVFQKSRVRQVVDFPSQFKTQLCSIVPHIRQPVVAILTPGIYNSAYFEHSWLALKMGAYLVEGRDLYYDGEYLCMRTTKGLHRIDILYRRVDDLFIDPEVFRSDSTLGCPGIMRAFKKGNLAIVNAPGTGVADDKVVYNFVPDMIKYYLGETAILPNVPTFLCAKKEDLDYTLANLDKLVVKPAGESGGYGMLVGPHASKEALEKFRKVLIENPSNYISQPTLSLSTAPTVINGCIEPRHVDLRPYVVQGARSVHVMSGGLTRVALTKGSLVVNSSQGGGTKDTWVVDELLENV